jgi:hypothetical protein
MFFPDVCDISRGVDESDEEKRARSRNSCAAGEASLVAFSIGDQVNFHALAHAKNPSPGRIPGSHRCADRCRESR